MIVTGIDPGLASCGWAQMNTDGGRLIAAGCITTSKSDGIGDTQRRLIELTDVLLEVIRPSLLVVVEWSSSSGGGFQSAGTAHGSARAALFNAAAAAAAIGIAQAHRIHVLSPAPVTWRSALGHVNDEAGLHARLLQAYPTTLGKLRRGALPHVLDAVGLAIYGRAHAARLFNPRNHEDTKTP